MSQQAAGSVSVDLNDSEIRANFIAVTSLCLMAAAYLCFVYVILHIISTMAFQDPGDHWLKAVILLSLFCELLLGYSLRHRHPQASRVTYVLALTLNMGIALSILRDPFLAYLSVIPVIASFALGPMHGVAALIISTAFVCTNVTPGPLMGTVLASLWLAASVQFVCKRGLQTALEWAWNSQKRAGRLLDQLRDRQARLNRTMAALTEATRRLQRTNSELIAARQEAEEARALKDQFAASVSHELRTPLNLVVGFTEMMYLAPETYEGMGWTPDLVGDLGELYAAGQHLQSLINDVLDLARIDASRLLKYLCHGEPVKVLEHVGDRVRVEKAIGVQGWLPAALVKVVSATFTELPMMCLAIGTVLQPGFLLDVLRAVALIQEMGRDALAIRLQVAALRFQAVQDAILLPVADNSEPESGP